MSAQENTSLYYQNSINIPYASQIGMHARKKIFDCFMRKMMPTEIDRIIDVGVTSEKTLDSSNFFERFYPFPKNITCVGTEDGSYLEKEYPGLRYQLVFPENPLPFKDNQFEIGFSNAVVEHAGNFQAQKFFISEICRISKRFFIVTPNRWFPFETHTGLPIVHYMPKPMFRKLLRNTKYSFWSSEDNLNLLGLKDFQRLFPENVTIEAQKVRILGFTSNLIISGTKNYMNQQAFIMNNHKSKE
jgi:hypothetical protein